MEYIAYLEAYISWAVQNFASFMEPKFLLTCLPSNSTCSTGIQYAYSRPIYLR
jgi:hypothetical protein